MSQECTCSAEERVEAKSEQGARYCRACGHWILKTAKSNPSSKRKQAQELTDLIMRTGKVVPREP